MAKSHQSRIGGPDRFWEQPLDAAEEAALSDLYRRACEGSPLTSVWQALRVVASREYPDYMLFYCEGIVQDYLRRQEERARPLFCVGDFLHFVRLYWNW